MRNRFPVKQLETQEKIVKKLIEPVVLCIVFQECDKIKGSLVLTKREIQAGGYWDPIKFTYHNVPEHLQSQIKYVKVHKKQYKMLLDCKRGMENEENKVFIENIVGHGSRRGGKTVLLAAIAALMAIGRPASSGMVVGLIKKHSDRVLAMLRKWFPIELWDHNKLLSEFEFNNGSVIYTQSEKNFNDIRGDGLDYAIIDEASFMKEGIYDMLLPSCLDKNGFVVLVGTPNNFSYFHRIALQGRKENPNLIQRDSTLVTRIAFTDNVFMSEAVQRRALQMAQQFDKRKYRREILGEFISDDELVFSNFKNLPHKSDRGNIIDLADINDYGGDVTEQKMVEYLRVRNAKYLVGVDFNYDPSTAVFFKFTGDGKIIMCEVLEHTGYTHQFAHEIYNFLVDLGCERPKSESVFVVDASSKYQDVGKDIKKSQAFKILRDFGYRLFLPQPTKKTNPSRVDKMEVFSSLVLNMGGKRTLYVSRRCERGIHMFNRLGLKDGMPDKKSEFIHLYDGASYPLYRIFHKRIDIFKDLENVRMD